VLHLLIHHLCRLVVRPVPAQQNNTWSYTTTDG
jgi:hypothetical protein